MRRITNLIITAGALCVGAAQAGSFLFDFNTDPTTSGLLTITGSGSWQPTGGVTTNANDGYLVISSGTSQSTTIIFSDFDSGSVVQGFTFEADLRIGNGTASPADGFSVNYCRSDDPVLTGGAFATGPNCEANLPEEGTQTGIGIGFDAWDSGGTAPYCNEANQSIGPDVAAVTVRVDGILVLQNACPTRNPTDPTDPTSVQTGPYDGTGSTDPLTWQHLKVQLTTDAKLSVWWKGTQILTNYQTTYFPSPGRLVFAGRCGGSWENQDLDNIAITTIPAQNVLPGTATGLGDGVSVPFFDSGAGQVDPTKPATISLDGGTPVPPSAIVKNATTTTLFYYGYPTLLVAGSQHTVTASVTDTLGRVITATNLPFTVGAYSVVNSAPAVAGVDTSKLGFRMRTYQTAAVEPNDIWWANEQLNGLQGVNVADTSSFTDNGYLDFVRNDSIGLAGYPNFDYGLNSDGVFTYGNGYPEAPWPGLTEGIPNTAIDNSSAELLCFLKFQNPGVYYMGVNSDDGFDVTVGPNPADWGSFSLGSYNGGRGASTSPDAFTFVITNTANFYPVRLMWENGTGGANCEWFVVKDGTRILLNDPSPTNNSGVTAYYSGPALPAFVSDLVPNPDRTIYRGDLFSANITDLGTTVTGTPKLYLDGAQFTTAAVSKSGTVTTIAAPSGYLLSMGAHSAQVVYSTSGGGPFTNSWNFTVGGYLLPAWAVTGVDTNKPGFRLKPYQTAVWPNTGTQPNHVQWTLEQLSGLHGLNAANLTTATDGGFIDYPTDTAGNGLINFSINGAAAGGFTIPTTTFPGMILGTDIADNGNESIDVVCFLQFTNAGAYTLGVNSDDGFAVYAGANPSDWAASVLLGSVDAGRGSADTTFTVYAPSAGIWPVRMIYENGNGSFSGGNGSSCAWFMLNPADGTRVLLNDPTVDTGVKVFYKGPALPAYISAFCPANGATGVLPYPMGTGLSPNAFGVQLTDGSTTVTPSSIAVTINGTAMTPVVSQSSTTPKVTTVTLPVTTPLSTGSNFAQFVYSTSAGSFTNTWGFTVAAPPNIVNSAWAVTGVNTADKGFQYRPWNSLGQPTTVWWTEEQLAGLHGPNNADLSILNDGAYFDYTGFVNFDIAGPDGNFQAHAAGTFFPNYPEIPFPGLPGANGQTDNSSFEMLTYLEFSQPGVYTMGVNSDDGFKVTVGPNPADWFALNLGQYDGGRGSSDTLFSFTIPAAGFYPFRLIYYNGGGGMNCEWFMVNADGSKILINDPAAPESTMVTSYYKGPALAAGITAVTPTPNAGTGNGLGSLSIKLSDNGTPVTLSSISLMIDGAGVNPVVNHANGITTITYDMIAAGTHTNTLCYSTTAGGPFCTTWTFTTTAAPDGGVTLPASLWTPPGSGSNQGFAFKVYQAPNTNIFDGWQCNARMADMALHGLYEVNVANLTDFTNKGAMWLPGVINFSSTDPTPTNAPMAGNFAASTYPDALFPGLGVYVPPGTTNATMNNDCFEAKTFLEFSKAGYYVMGVNSDDGFRVTVGDQSSPGKSPLAVLAPASLAGEVTAMYTTTADEGGNNGFGAAPPSTVPIISRVVLADPIDASTALVNASALKGNIAFIQRGVTAFTAKYDAARDAGAVAVIIGNNSANDNAANTYPGTMAGTDATNTIPALWVNYAIGTNLMANATTTTSSPLIARITAQDCSPIVGKDDAPKGTSDVLFGFTVPQPGVYPFRLIWENGGGGAACEWFIRDPALGDFLVGDPAGPVKAWITRDVKYAGALSAPVMTTPVVSGSNVMVGWTGEGELWEAYSLNGPWFKSTFTGNPATVVPNELVPERFFRVRQY
jgi:hypothetical protein